MSGWEGHFELKAPHACCGIDTRRKVNTRRSSFSDSDCSVWNGSALRQLKSSNTSHSLYWKAASDRNSSWISGWKVRLSIYSFVEMNQTSMLRRTTSGLAHHFGPTASQGNWFNLSLKLRVICHCIMTQTLSDNVKWVTSVTLQRLISFSGQQLYSLDSLLLLSWSLIAPCSAPNSTQAW